MNDFEFQMGIGDTFELTSNKNLAYNVIYKITSILDGVVLAETTEVNASIYLYASKIDEFRKDMISGSVFNYKFVNSVVGARSCFHTYTRYTGFTHVYDYCTKCDTKKEVPWRNRN